MMFMLNTVKPPLDNKLVRQALAYSFPYDQYVERSENTYTQSRGAAPPGMWGGSDDLPQYQHDLDKAKELLAEAGYPDGGFEIQVTYMVDFPAEVWAIELWEFPLAELGIELNAQGMTFDALWELAKSDPSTAQDIATFSWWPTWITPYDVLVALYHCEDEPFFNVTYWCNPEFDELIDDANVLTGKDRESATQKFIAAQEILLEEVPTMFLFDLPQTFVVSADIDGVELNPAYNYVIFYHDLTTTR
jgi:peptide/nickel transport system substrate-binding protein